MVVAHSPAWRFVLYWLPVLVWVAVILLLSNLSGTTVGKMQDELSISRSTGDMISVVVHIGEFAALAVLIYRLLATYPKLAGWPTLSGALALVAGYGAIVELGQSMTPGRETSASDIGLNTLGALIGLMLAEGSVRLYRLARKKRPAV